MPVFQMISRYAAFMNLYYNDVFALVVKKKDFWQNNRSTMVVNNTTDFFFQTDEAFFFQSNNFPRNILDIQVKLTTAIG